MFAPYSPAISPATKPPLPAFDIAPPPLPPSQSPSPVTSPAASVPPTSSSTVPLAPTNSAPPPVASPAIPAPPVLPPPSPESLLVPASSPAITSNESPDSPTSSPVILLPPAVPPVSLETPAAPVRRKFPPSIVEAVPPTATFPPTLHTPLITEPPLPSWATTPSSPMSPASSPEVKFRPTPSGGSLPVAVEVHKLSAFNMSSGLKYGLLVIGAIIFVFVLAIVSVLWRNKKKNKQKNRCTDHHDEEESSPGIGSKGSHVIRVLSNPTLPPHLTEGCGASGSVNTIPNLTPSISFGPVNGVLTYEELIVATNRFSESNLLGQGGFGYVYKGVLPSGKEIAVKKLKTGSQQGEREFQAEVEIISRVYHKHLVELIGYCVTKTERLLVYEFVPNNTLEFHLHGERRNVIEWARRIKIALASAKGLAYLHEDCNPAIIHRDIKASNILLDFKFEAKVSDFGLAKIFPITDSCITHLTTQVVGTFGYLAPEYVSSGKLTDKSDVYSYGVMLLELITGRLPITAAGSRNESLVDWARPLLAQALQDCNFNNLVDPRLQKNYDADEMARMITCAAACVRHSARLRPRMSQIVGALEGLVSLTDLVGDITPGHTMLYNWSDSSDYDASQYQQDIRSFNLALSCQNYSSSGHSESTSAYGFLHP